VAASFLMYMTPVPSGIDLPQNEQRLELYDKLQATNLFFLAFSDKPATLFFVLPVLFLGA
jgi:hypothetical protein